MVNSSSALIRFGISWFYHMPMDNPTMLIEGLHFAHTNSSELSLRFERPEKKMSRGDNTHNISSSTQRPDYIDISGHVSEMVRFVYLVNQSILN